MKYASTRAFQALFQDNKVLKGLSAMPKWSVLEYLRKNPERYKEMVRRRGLNPSLVDEFRVLDEKYLRTLKEVERLRSEYNRISRSISRLQGEERTKALDEARLLSRRLEEKEREFEKVREEWSGKLKSLPNLLAEDVPEGYSEEENVPVRFYGRPKVLHQHIELFKQQTERWGFKVEYQVVHYRVIPHADMLETALEMGDTLQAAQVAGSRFYYLFDDLVWLDFALSLYALEVLASKGYRLVIPPYMIRTEVLEGAIDYDTFKDMIYKIEGEDLNLIGTAEHPLLGLLYKRPVREDELPIRLAGWSVCFRKEAGAGSRDLKGIFRVHQFHKVEQFVFAHPEDSWRFLEEMTLNAEEILRGLELPYRVVKVVSGEVGVGVAKKYDIEVWYPSQGRYREIASISHMLDWQAFRANLMYLRVEDGRREYVHTLNGTGLPTTRAITAILEQHQKEDGVVEIPKALRKYLESIPSAPKDVIVPRKRVKRP